MVPVVAPAGTVAFSCEDDTNVALTGETPWNLTVLGFVNPTPLTVTTVPTGPLAGVKPVRLYVTVKGVWLLKLPAAVERTILPVVDPGGVRILTSLSEKTVNGTGLAFSVAPVVPARYVPVTATRVPTAPLAGVKPLIVGGRWKLIRRMLPVPRSR